MYLFIRSTLLTLGITLIYTPAWAALIDLSAINSGFITSEGGSSKFDGLIVSAAEYNYSVGWEDHYDGGGLKPTVPLIKTEKKNFFVFDFGTISDPITAATLSLALPAGGYTSPDVAESFVLAGTSLTSGELASLSFAPTVPVGTPPGFDIDPGAIMAAKDFFGVLTESIDLGVPEFGTAEVTLGDEASDITITLSSDGISYLNSHLGSTLVLGGFLDTIGAPLTTTQEIFSGTAPFPEAGSPGFITTATPVLSITTTPVPLPAAFPLLGIGLGGLAIIGYRNKRVA